MHRSRGIRRVLLRSYHGVHGAMINFDYSSLSPFNSAVYLHRVLAFDAVLAYSRENRPLGEKRG